MTGERSYQELFLPDFWRQLSLDQRVGLLQDLENDQARQAGRAPQRVAAVEMPDLGNCGELDPVAKTIKVSAAHIQHDAMEFWAVHTVLHEGRHAYQKAAIQTDGLHHDPDQVRLWKENSAVYVPNSEKSFLIYRNQPIERDADAHANSELNNIFNRLERAYGKIELCEKYTGMLEAEARFVAEKTRAKYGDDFAARIDRTIRQAYQITHKEAYRITLSKSGDAPLTRIATVEKDLPVKEKEILVKKAAHDLIYQSVSHAEQLLSINVQIEKVDDLSAPLLETHHQIENPNHQLFRSKGPELVR